MNNPCNDFNPTPLRMLVTDPAGMSFDTLLVANRGEIARRIIRTAARAWACARSPSTPTPTGPRRTSARPTSRSGSAPLRPASPTCASRPCSTRPRRPAPGRSTPATASSPRAPSSPARSRRPASPSSARRPTRSTASAPSTPRATLAAEAAGVPLLAGTGLLGSADEAVAAADEIGLPVMLKATGGGGGHRHAGVPIGRRGARRRTTGSCGRRRASFGSAGVFLERLVQPARHVEVQLFGDGAGRVAVLGDRDCSLQRRNQKVIEEAPAPALPDDVRAPSCTTTARALAESVDYRSAGTVEFVYDPVREEASFLEVNTRLQVEHPVTELVHGVDLVELMLRLARDGATGVDDVFAGSWPADRARRRGPGLRRGPGQGEPALQRAGHPGVLPRGRQPRAGRGPRRQLDRDRAGGLAALRPAARQGDRLGPDPRRCPRPAAARGSPAAASTASSPTSACCASWSTRSPLRSATHSTSTLDVLDDPEPRVDVIDAGAMTTVQDLPGARRLLAGRGAALRTDGPALAARGQPRCRQPRGRAGLEVTATGPDAAVLGSRGRVRDRGTRPW